MTLAEQGSCEAEWKEAWSTQLVTNKQNIHFFIYFFLQHLQCICLQKAISVILTLPVSRTINHRVYLQALTISHNLYQLPLFCVRRWHLKQTEEIEQLSVWSRHSVCLVVAIGFHQTKMRLLCYRKLCVLSESMRRSSLYQCAALEQLYMMTCVGRVLCCSEPFDFEKYFHKQNEEAKLISNSNPTQTHSESGNISPL